MSKYIFFNIWNEHFKMWGFDVYSNGDTNEYTLTTYYGKIRDSISKLTIRKKDFPDRWSCLDYIDNKINDKLAKGYVRMENVEYGKYTCGEITLSELVAKIEQQKVGLPSTI